MSKVAVVHSSDLISILRDLTALIQKGGSTLVIGITTKDSEMKFTVNSGVAYTAVIPASETIPVDISVVYTPMEDFIPQDCVVTLDVGNSNATFSSTDFRVTLEHAYSVTVPVEVPEDCEWHSMENFHHALPGLKALVSTGLSTYYKREQPVNIYGNVSAVFYPNIRLQVRTIGIDFKATLPADHCRLLITFIPESYSILGDWIYFRRDRRVLVLPYRPPASQNMIPDIVAQMASPVTLTKGEYPHKVQVLAKMKFTRLTIVIYEQGIVTQSFGKSTTVSIPLGDVNGVPIVSFIVPVDLWNICVKLIKSDTLQILYNKEGVLCLRTTAETIVLRAVC